MRKRLHNILLLLFSCSVLSGCSLPRETTAVISRDLSGDQTWSGQVEVHGDIVLEAGSTLRILPGTEVVFFPAGNNDRFSEHPNFPGSELIVHGKIVAEGTPDRPIVFRYVDESAPPGSWGGINVVESFDSSFEYAHFRQADSAIHSQDSRVYIEQSLFEMNLVAIRFHTSQILIENNLIRNNGSGIRFHFGQPVICKNDIIGNERGFFITSHPRNYLIENNTIVNNERSVVIGEEVPEDVNMPRNFWGSSNEVVIRAGFYDGQVDSYLGKILVEPIRTAPDPDSGINWNR